MLSMKAKYALKALVILAKSGQEQMRAKTIAAQAGAPYKFLEAILNELRNNGILISRRGAEGGYMLARTPKSVKIGDVLRIIDGPLALLPCASVTAYRKCEDCPDEGLCSLRGVMMEARSAVSSVLDNRSLQDMAEYEEKFLADGEISR